mgnify:CR=1 FL=1
MKNKRELSSFLSNKINEQEIRKPKIDKDFLYRLLVEFEINFETSLE